MPSLSVCLLLDHRADRAVRRLWRQLEDDGVRTLATYTHGRHVPHVTLADVGVADLEHVLEVCRGATPAPATPVVFAALGAFPRSRCSLIPSVPAELLVRQASLAQRLAATGLTVSPHYLRGTWLPHLTLGPRQPVEALPGMARRVYEVLPLRATLARAAVVDTTAGEVHPV
jgi:2'-5' RNA ligase